MVYDRATHRLRTLSTGFFRALGFRRTEGTVLHPQYFVFSHLDSLPQHLRMDGHAAPPCNADRHHSSRAGVPRAVSDRAMARGQQNQAAVHRLCLHGVSVHLHFGAGILRLRGARQRETPRFRQRSLVGVDERYDGRGRDIPRNGHRQDHLRATADSRHDDVPDFHHVHSIGISETRKESVIPEEAAVAFPEKFPYL